MHQSKLRKVLQWLAFVARPIRVEELAEVLAVDVDGMGKYDPKSKPINPGHIFKLGAGLITTSYVSTQKSTAVVAYYEHGVLDTEAIVEIRLAHLSVKDYLLSNRIRNGLATVFAMDTRLSNSYIAETCLIYLLHSPFRCGFCEDHATLERLLIRWPLLSYAAHFWPHHINQTGDELSGLTFGWIEAFFDTKAMPRCGNFGLWGSVLTPDFLQAVERTVPLYYACSFGMTTVVKKLLSSGEAIDLNKRGGRYSSTPLQTAAFRGHVEVVRMLLNAGPDLSWSEPSNGSALFWALNGGYYLIAKMLLDHGAALSIDEVLDFNSFLRAKGTGWREMGSFMVYGEGGRLYCAKFDFEGKITLVHQETEDERI